jgi:type IV pilus assembly protein PilE
MHAPHARGFTLIEVMVTVAIVAILAGIAFPAYNSSLQRSRVSEGLDLLSAYASRMEQRYQDVGNYGTAGCAPSLPSGSKFAMSCLLNAGGQGYTATVTGSGVMAGYAYTINHNGVRRTTAHPKGVPDANCWSIRGSTCDS